MTLNKLVVFFLLLFVNNYSQNIFFIKYSNETPLGYIQSKIKQKDFFPPSLSQKNSQDAVNATFFAKGLGANDLRLSRIVKVATFQQLTASELNEVLNFDSNIEYIQKGLTYKIDNTPNDSLISQQWALDKIGAYKAWEISTGADTISIGIIDTGIDFYHPDLKNKIARNLGETGIDANGKDKSSNGIDDDGNGFVDDYMGWDFVDRVGFPFDSTAGDYLVWDNYPMDENGYSHGTAVAGIIGAETNNSIGIAGVGPKLRLLNLRAFDPGGYGEEDDVASAILYAVKMKAKVINMSFGDYTFSYVLRDVIRYAYANNVVLVASSGNSNSQMPHYPSGYTEVISVGNSTPEDYVAGSSNYGSTLDLVAPGTSIITTARNNKYTDFNGTSAASPFVSAAAGLIRSVNNFTNEEVKQIIKTTADDIGELGWDIRSGAGRLNIKNALTILPASKVKFDFPYQDYATNSNKISIVSTVQSPYFVDFSLYYGVGHNPSAWTLLVDKRKSQFKSDTVSVLSLNGLSDTVYTLRMVVNQSTGRTTEERLNFHIIRTAPKAQVVSIIPAYYGEKSTIMGAMYSETNCVGRMYYREYGTTNFDFISLDGFSANNQFVKQLHYGFIPKNISKPNTIYEVYFEVENLVGFKTVLKDSLNYFVVKTDGAFDFINRKELSYTLPGGYIFETPMDISASNEKSVVLRDNNNASISNFYTFKNNSFVKSTSDSLVNKIVKDYGDFNNNGKKDILSLWSYTAFIDSQATAGNIKFKEASKVDSRFFWPIMAKDIDKDGKYELLALTAYDSISVYRIESNLKLTYLTSFSGFNRVQFNSPNALLIDSDKDGKNELWMIDSEGDILSYNVNSASDIKHRDTIITGYATSSSFLTAGDYNGDGKLEIAVILQSVEEQDIAPYNRLIIFNLMNNKFNTYYDHAFIDPTSEYKSSFQKANNSIKFVDVDNDGKEELVFFVFPYSYIIKNYPTESKIISYIENINSNAILAYDFNGNGAIEIAYPLGNTIKFIEYGSATRPPFPSFLTGYSQDTSKILISWQQITGNKYYIYRGDSSNSMKLIDSTLTAAYTDSNVQISKQYLYAVKVVDNSKPNPVSEMSAFITVYHHKPAMLLSVSQNSSTSINIQFSNTVKTSIDNLNHFAVLKLNASNVVIDTIRINSVTAASQFSYLITLSKPFTTGGYRVIVKGLDDNYGSNIKSDSSNFVFTETLAVQELFLSSFQIVNNHLIKLVFNIDLDKGTALNIANYEFDPANQIKSISIDSSSKIVYLDLSGGKPVGAIGLIYRLKIRNLVSSASTGSVKINEGAGSIAVLTSFANDLSDVYVYPSPAEVKDGSGFLTFANIPNNVEIDVIKLNGERVITLSDRSGIGGLKWNLRDNSGNLLNTGIYIYRIVMKDASNNEIATKKGKFTVVR